MNTWRFSVSFLAIILCACVQGASDQQALAFADIKQAYESREAVAFTVVNTSKTRLLYWISLEQRQGSDWGTVYSSLAGFRDDMSEPVITLISPGEKQEITFVPADNPRFALLNQRSESKEYRFVLLLAEKTDDVARAHQILSRTFQVK